MNSKSEILSFLSALLFLNMPVLLPAQEYQNRYAFDLVKTGNGYKIKDEQKIRALSVLDMDNLPADMFAPYHGARTFILESEYKQCQTRSFVYKTYPDYELRLEVDIPPGEGKFPFIMWIHGGGWESGDLYGLEGQSKYLAAHGIAGVRISYSLLPQGGNMLKAWADIQDALTFIRNHAQDLKIDSSTFGFAGHSAGAHLSAYAAMRVPKTKLLIALNGAYDLEHIQEGFEPKEHHFQFLGKTSEEKRMASPVNFVHPQAPFCLLGYSMGDYLVDPTQVERLAARLDKNNVRYELMVKDIYSHAAFLATDLYEPTLMKMLITAKTHLK